MRAVGLRHDDAARDQPWQSLSTARVEVTPHSQSRDPHVTAARVRERHRPVQLHSRSVDSNLRLRWEYLPGSERFVVYTGRLDHRHAHRLLVASHRALVVKIDRLFRP